ncbi:MAG: sigma-70 family RNA polymerase sigma factor [Bacteroidetes bacterium]|nr:sigma-70 family RNA polymerase sigma factor [Bacteroidota bacterium]
MDDVALVNALKAGNTNAFRFLVDKYRNLVWHMVLRMTNRREDAEDLCQEVFIRVFKQIDNFRGESKLSTWIGSIAYNACVDHMRKSKKEVLSSADPIVAINLAQSDVSPLLNNIDRITMTKLVHRIIEKMPLQYRTVITLFHLEEFTYREIEEITGMPEGTVKSYLSRGREIIRRKLTELVPDIRPVLFEA